jgi:hypothetical protein
MEFPPVDAYMAFNELAFAKIDELLQQSYKSLVSHPFLCHYTRDKVVVDSLKENGRFWATSAEHMSDSTELIYGANIVTSILDEFLALNPGLPFEVKEFIEMAKERANPFSNKFTDKIETFFVCFSEQGDLEHQWKNYANDSKGYCLHLALTADYTDPKSAGSIEFLRKNMRFLKVIYDPQEQRELVINTLRDFVNLIEDGRRKYGVMAMGFGMPASVALYEVLCYYVMSFKDATLFSEEREWRCVYGMSNFRRRELEVKRRRLRNADIPYVEMPLISTEGPFGIHEVVKGQNCTD